MKLTLVKVTQFMFNKFVLFWKENIRRKVMNKRFLKKSCFYQGCISWYYATEIFATDKQTDRHTGWQKRSDRQTDTQG